MIDEEEEEKRLREVTSKSAKSIFLARQRAEEELRRTKQELEGKTAELARSLAMMRATFESTTDGILVTDGEGRVTDCNQKYADMWGLPSEVTGAQDHRQLIDACMRHFEDPDKFIGRVEEIYATSPPESYDLLELSDGRSLERFSKIQYVDGLHAGRVWTFRDVTETRRAERALRERVRLSALRAEVAGVLAESRDLQSILQKCSEVLVRRLEFAFARIWTLDEADAVLKLQASAGLYTHRDGPHSRVEVGQFKIGKIAAERKPHLTNDVPNDPRVSDPEWARREGIVAFAGYPLLVEGRCVGVLAIFSQHELSETVLADLHPVADGFAQCIERKRAEDSLRERSELWRVTLSSIGDAVITTDTAGRVTSLNGVAMALTGWNEPEAIGAPLETVFQIVNEQSRLPVENPAERSLREGKIVGLANHTVLIARDGTEHAIDDSAAPITDPHGELCGVVLIFRDVSEQRRDEERLRQSEAQFRQLADAQPQIVWTARPDGFIDYYNERWYEYTGFARDDYGDGSWKPILHPDDVQRCLDTYYSAINSGRPYQIEYRFKDRRTGGYRWFLGRAFPARDDNGAINRWFGSCTDINDTKHAEEATRFLADASAALAELTDYQSTLQRVASLAVPFFADWCAVEMREGETSVSRLAVTHIDPTKVRLAHELFRRYPPRPDDSHGVMKVLRTGIPEWFESLPDAVLEESAQDEEHLQMIRELGLKSYICVPLKSRSGTLGAVSFVTAESGRVYSADDLRSAEDLAHRAVIAIENARLLATLKESDQRKDEFLAILAHELRNPLAPMRSAVQILREVGPSIPTLEWARDVIDRQIDQMTRLVDDLLDVSRITRGKIELRKKHIALREVVEDAIDASRPLVSQFGHTLTIDLPRSPVFLDADPARLAQVIQNLLNNAAKYMDHGGEIWLRAELEGNEVVITVKDTGIGLPDEMISRIFDMFTQVDGSSERSQGGLGIGLTLVQRMIAMHGGSIEARSEGPQKGSQFIVRLPTVEKDLQPLPVSPTAGKRVQREIKHRILVVDDNKDAADSLAMFLQIKGHDVRTADDGLAAVQEAEAFQPGVILLDIGLPTMNGYKVAERIRQERGETVLLIALTGWGQQEDRQRSQEAGFDHHLTKPVDFDSLSRLLDVELDGR